VRATDFYITIYRCTPAPEGGSSTNSKFSPCLALAAKKAKEGKETRGNQCRTDAAKLEEEMKRKKTKRKQRGCDLAKTIDTVEQAVSTAKKIYRTIEPVVRAIIRNSTKAK
jgi:hypothetical protein